MEVVSTGLEKSSSRTSVSFCDRLMKWSLLLLIFTVVNKEFTVLHLSVSL